VSDDERKIDPGYGPMPDPAALNADILRRLADLECRQSRTEGDDGKRDARLDRLERLVLRQADAGGV
jgi:hypothetical protein